ncbi:MAG TPA: four-carbon acid sugar kinase family protein [Candidatus Eisenbergiella merdavium]|uniref:Four-carbon acid sugar kinase family protein n=1 Tax=Candidatus Eisenbergiella merdavium TaxID=2838551 RepID=A0A9D2NCR0_9FIRM|nr:four-carbon acid sugar kinase family protein [Candidatus Eisenbergiella merdavium]
MKKLLVIADDFTGALDTGIQFAASGAVTEILTDTDFDFREYPSTEVFIVDTETRHVSGQEAYRIVYGLVKNAVNAGIDYLYKKTDSGLRGNIAVEVMAALDASGEDFLAFLPAFPEMKRTVENGISYIEGVPLEKSVFGKDPFEPVTCSRVKDFFGKRQEIVKEYHDPSELCIMPGKKQIAIFDSVTDADQTRIGIYLQRNNLLRVAAGCAGFASVIAGLLNISSNKTRAETVKGPLLVMCGSVNEISKRQLACAQKKGYPRVTLTVRQQLESGYLESEEGKTFLKMISQICRSRGVCMIDTCSDRKLIEDYMEKGADSLECVRVRIAERLGEIMKELIGIGLNPTLMVIGGDTLFHFVREVKCRQISLLSELEKGVVYSWMKIDGNFYGVISKSGGFGDEMLLIRLIEEKLKDGRNENAETIFFEDAL